MTPAEFADKVGTTPQQILRILRNDAQKPESERRIRGAVKYGEGTRCVYDIPESAIATFELRPVGRPRTKAATS